MKSDSKRKLAVVGLFAIAMAFIETLIVVYLRMIYYPYGFNFPLNPLIPSWVYSVEVVREIFTIVMLVCIAILVAKKFSVRFAYFLYAFAMWDIFYYVWLKVILNWPASFLTWDVLFLIPIPWIGPVLTPLICSVVMIVFAYIIIDFNDSKKNVKINKNEWILLIVGSLTIIGTWLIDFFKLIFLGGFVGDFFSLLDNNYFKLEVITFVPEWYCWGGFIVGIGLIVFAIARYYIRLR